MVFEKWNGSKQDGFEAYQVKWTKSNTITLNTNINEEKDINLM